MNIVESIIWISIGFIPMFGGAGASLEISCETTQASQHGAFYPAKTGMCCQFLYSNHIFIYR